MRRYRSSGADSTFFTNAISSDITQQMGTLLQSANLELAHDEPFSLGGAYKVALATKGEQNY
jgi:hypothetical protein